MARIGDPRLGQLLKAGLEGELVLLGFPFDEGVKRNGGRVGAKNGPSSVRKYLKAMGTLSNPEFNTDIRNLSISDGGDISNALSFEDAHKELTNTVEKILSRASIPFVIGGGNDQSYPNAKGLLNSEFNKNVGVVNIDAHFDVRPLTDGVVHSGTPFYQLLHDEAFTTRGNGKFVEFASQGSQCSQEHADFIRSKNGKIIWLSDIKSQKKSESMSAIFEKVLNDLGDNVFVSFDLDAVRGSDAPGVSCSSCVGLSPQDALDICFTAGKHQNVRLFDLSEFNPDIEDYRTGRLVVMMFYYFAMGLSERKKKVSN